MGPPQDIEGECNAHLYLCDDYQDNTCTVRCHLPTGHEGKHREEFNRGEGKEVLIEWEKDEKPVPVEGPPRCVCCYDKTAMPESDMCVECDAWVKHELRDKKQ